MHKIGFHHLDFRPENVARKGREYRLIDLEEIETHKCHFDGNFKADEPEPDFDDFGCKILYYYGSKMEIWKLCELLLAFLSSISKALSHQQDD